MQFFSNLAIGFKAYWKALFFIKEHKMYWYILFPALLMIAVYKFGEILQQRRVEASATNMNELIWFLIYTLIEISLALLLMNFAKYLVVIVLSPLLAHLSMKTEHILTGNTYPFDLQQFIHDVKRGLIIAFRNIFWQYVFFALIFLVAFLIWGDAKQSPLYYLIFVIGAYYYGFSFIDYVNERLKMNVSESVEFMRQNSGLAIAIGSVYSILIFMPVNLEILFSFNGFKSSGIFLNILEFILHMILWLAASSAPILTIVASTVAMNDFVGLKKHELLDDYSQQ
jgi:CysZ protein